MQLTSAGHLAAARRAAGREWTFGPEGPLELGTHPFLGDMVMAGLIKPHYVTPEQQIAGQDDYYRLTEAGEWWLAEHQESA